MFLTFVMAAMLAGQAREHPRVSYDKFEDKTAVRAMLEPREFDGKSHRLVLSFSTYHSGRTPRPLGDDTIVSFSAVRFRGGLRYQEFHEVRMMCGDEIIPVTDSSYSHHNENGGNEFLHASISLGTMRKFAERNEPWDIKLGPDEPFALSQGERALLIEFCQLLTDGKA